MSQVDDDAAAVGMLLRFALTRRTGPPSDEHLALLKRYKAEPQLRAACDATAHGLGLRVMDADPDDGLLLAAADGDSPFRMRLADFFPRQTTGVQKRMMLACAMVACFVAFFPRPEDLEERVRLRRLDVDEIDRLVRDIVARLDSDARERGEELDPPTDEPDLARAWAIWRSTSNSRKATDGREREVGTRQIVARCLDLLAEQGLVRTIERGQTYASTRRMQAMARELAGSLVWWQGAREHSDTQVAGE